MRREEERFDEARLHAYLRDRVPGAEAALEVRQFPGGHANLTYRLRFGAGDAAVEYVLRRPPLGPVAPGEFEYSGIKTNLDESWVGLSRVHGWLEAIFERKWSPSDIEGVS